MNLQNYIEGILFFKATPMKLSALAKQLAVSEEEIRSATIELSSSLKNRGVNLIITDREVQLVTAPSLDPIIEEIRREELRRDIGKAGAETLAIILYRGPITRAEIDRIRGVNSSFIIRNLLMRGLISREQSGRGNVFSATPTLLAHLGITQVTELKNYASILDTLEAFEREQQVAEQSP